MAWTGSWLGSWAGKWAGAQAETTTGTWFGAWGGNWFGSWPGRTTGATEQATGTWFGEWNGSWAGSWWSQHQAGSATAHGALLVVTASVLSGAAVGESVNVGESGFALPRRLDRVDGRARGRIVKCSIELLPGRARSVSLLEAGSGHADANVDGAALEHRGLMLLAGGANGIRNWSDEELLILAEAA